MKRAYVIGSGPNGLSAAIVLAQAGIDVEVFEAEAVPGGGARTLPLTLPGFLHDFGSAVHPLGAGSPFFTTLPLAEYRLRWIHGDAPMAHPLDDGTAVMLERNIADQDREFGSDAQAWRSLVMPLVDQWDRFAEESLGPVLRIPRHPLFMARFGVSAFQPARRIATHRFTQPRTRALFAGLAAHSFLSLDDALSSAVALVLGAAAHKVGWPVPQGGSQSITNALIGHLQRLGGKVYTSCRVNPEIFHKLNAPQVGMLFDTSPRQLVGIAGDRLTNGFRGLMERFKPGPGVFKIDYALSQPVPWRAAECKRAITVHLGGSFEEIAEAEDAVSEGPASGTAFRAHSSAIALRPEPRAAGAAYLVGLLSCAQRIYGRYDRSPRSTDRAFCARLSRLHLGAECFEHGDARTHGCEPARRRHQRRSDDNEAVSAAPVCANL